MNPFSKTSLAFADTEPMGLGMAADLHYAPTEPAPLLPERAAEPRGLSLAPIEAGEYELMAECRKGGRVCPLPTRWLEFYRVLHDHAGRGVVMPSTPLTGSAWAATPNSVKRMCMREQIDWAVAERCVTPAYEFLKALPDSDWLVE